jgi:hypothetical protein
MAIVGVWETGVHLGTINTSYLFGPDPHAPATMSLQHNFASPVDLWSRPYLQGVSMNASDGWANVWVAQFVDQKGAHSGSFQPGIFAQKCTSVTFNLFTRDCFANVVCTTEIFG